MTELNNHGGYFQFRPDIAQLHHEYDDGVVLFDPLTSDTRLFNPIVQWLINTVSTLPFEQEATLARLVNDYQNDNPIELATLLNNTLASLARLGFIQRN